MKAQFIIAAAFFCFLSLNDILAQDIYINEFLAANASINSDSDYDAFSDWIEIYNADEHSLELGGYFLSDDADSPMKWRIPDETVIQGRDYILLWADGRDDAGNVLHANFNLNKTGEFIGLYDALGRAVDSLSYTAQTTDISFGRMPDGGDEWFFFNRPTPNAANSGDFFQKAKTPQFSIPGGFYTERQTLVLSCDDPSTVIRYTLDCSDPSQASPVYDSPLVIKNRTGDANYFSEIRTTADPEAWLPDWVPPVGEVFKATVVRARGFKTGQKPSDIKTHTYFIDPNIAARYPTIAVISLVSDYQNLFADATGIYVPGAMHQSGRTGSGNYFQNWEKPAHIEFFEGDGSLAFSQDVGIKIQGGTSPASPQKGLHVIARSEYGSNRIKYPIFAHTRFAAREIQEYKRFMIRAWGSTINAALFNDAYAQALAADTDLDLNAYRPAVLFIDGEYWGLHELREANKNSWYFQSHYGINRDDPGFDLLEHTERGGKPYAAVDAGDAHHWNAMMWFLETHDMSAPENYDYIKTQMDVNNFIEYIGHCVYLVKWDWPNNNEASWRQRTPDGRWRWIQYDMETSFGVAATLNPMYGNLGASFDMIHNVIYGTPIIGFGQYGPHPVLALLLQNEIFKHDFVKWLYDNMKTRFSPGNMIALLDEMAAEIEPYLPEYRQRWPFVTQMNNDWQFHLELIKDFAKNRPKFVRQHLAQEFGAETAVLHKQEKAIPANFQLAQNAPNPFNSSTVIEYNLPRAEIVSLEIYDLSGRQVAVLVNASKAAGRYSERWDARNAPSGIYFARFQAGGKQAVRKMALAR